MSAHTGFDIVDAQVHLTSTLDRAAISASMDALGIGAVVIDELWTITDSLQPLPSIALPDGGFRPLSLMGQAAAIDEPHRFSYLQRVEHRDPQLAEVMTLLASEPGARAARVVLHGSRDRAAFGNGGFNEVLGHAERLRLPLCVLGIDLATLPGVVNRFPDLQIVLDHCGWARSQAHWEDVLAAAAHDTVVLKWSHAARVFGTGAESAETVRKELVRAVEIYGSHRVLWASDVTMEESDATWAELLSVVYDHPGLSDDDKAWVLGRTARAVFGWDAPSRP